MNLQGIKPLAELQNLIWQKPYGVTLPKRSRAALRQADVANLALSVSVWLVNGVHNEREYDNLLHKLCHGSDSLFNGDIWVGTG